MPRLLKYSLPLIILIGFGYKSFGQYHVRVPVVRQPQPYRQRVVVQAPARRLELIKENYISRRLNLSFAQARQFWPVYRRYVQDQTAIRIAKADILKSSPQNDPNAASRILDLEAQLVDVRKQYLDEFMKILPPDKVTTLFQAEHEFNTEMVKQLGERPPGK